MKNTKETIVILHNIRSAYNVGSVFRTSDAAGVEKIFLTGFTPTPIDRFGRPQPEIAKTALGAEKNISWEHRDDVVEVCEELKKEGVQVVAVEQTSEAIDYKTFTPHTKTAFVFGNEVDGLPQEILSCTDAIIEIPMQGKKESLNVSVVVGIVLFNVER